MTIDAAVRYAGYLMQVVSALQQLAAEQGVSPEEFRQRASEECKRLGDWNFKLAETIGGLSWPK